MNKTVSNNTCFNLEQFLKRQYQIYKKFIPPTKNDTDLERFDKLYINLIEEMYEYNEEENNELKKQELVDVIMYTGTCIVVWYDHYEKEIKEVLKDIQFSSQQVQVEDMDDIFYSHIMNIIKIRRNFSERKWHKPVIHNQQLNEHVKNLVTKNLMFMKVYIDHLFFQDNFIEDVIERIKNKQDYILNLNK